MSRAPLQTAPALDDHDWSVIDMLDSKTCRACGRSFADKSRGRPRVFCEICRPPTAYQPRALSAIRCAVCATEFQGRAGGMYCSPRCRRRGATEVRRIREAVLCAGGCGRTLHGSQNSLPAGERRCRRCRWVAEPPPEGYGGKKPHSTYRWRRLRAQVIAEESDCWICGDPVDKTLAWPHPFSPSGDHVVPVNDGGAMFDRMNVRLAHLSCNIGKGVKVLDEAISSGDLRRQLEAIRDRLGKELADAGPREIASIAKALTDVVVRLDGLPGEEKSALDDLAQRRATRQSKVS